jgi:hypothetical protein
MNGIKPKIDDAYWFTFSEKLVNNAQDSRDQAAGKLQALVVWLWGIYTASAAVGFALSGKGLSWGSTLLIAAASFFLVAVYWGAVWVQVPVLVKFDPRSPTEIMQAYKTSLARKDRRLKVTLGLSMIAAIMVSLALIIASVSGEKVTASGFVASIHSTKGGRELSLTGTVGQTKVVTVHVRPVGGKPVESRSFTRIPTDKGLLQTSIPLDTNVSEVEVTLEWEDSGRTKTQLSKTVREEKKTMSSS